MEIDYQKFVFRFNVASNISNPETKDRMLLSLLDEFNDLVNSEEN
jgi:hypothetical protein